MTSIDFGIHVARVQQALARWCRHVRCSTHLVVLDATLPERAEGREPTRERIDTPLAVPSAVSVEVRDGAETFVVGCGASAGEPGGPFAAFYNRGLTLHETREPLGGLRGMRFAVDSPALAHTLSRDDVRRDAAFDRMLARVRRIAKGPLRAAAATRLGELAHQVARGEQLDAYAVLFRAAGAPPLELPDREVSVPLTDARDGIRSMRLAEVRRASPGGAPLVAAESDPLTASLAAARIPVVRLPGELLASRAPATRNARADYVLVRPAEPAMPSDAALCDAVGRALGVAGAGVATVGLCALVGARPDRSAVIVPGGRPGERVCSVREIDRWWRRWRSSAVLLLDFEDEAVSLARSRAGTEPFAAADLLARIVLLQARGVLGGSANDGLLLAALGRMP
jgi:hypothetical protein